MKRYSLMKQPLGLRHFVGAGILVVGVAGLAKLFVLLGHSQAARVNRSAQLPPSGPTGAEGLPRMRAENTRGQYGSRLC